MAASKRKKGPAASELPEKVQQLLDAQVQFTLEQIDADNLPALLNEQWALVESIAGDLCLNDVTSAEAISDAVLALYPQLELTLLGKTSLADLATLLHGHPIHETTTLADLVPESQFNAMVDWGLGQHEWRRALIHDLVTNPIFASMISEMLITGIREYVSNSDVADRVPGAKSALKIGKAFVNRAKPDLGSKVEENLKNYVERNAEGRLKSSEAYLNRLFEGDDLAQQIDAIWVKYSNKPLSTFVRLMDPALAEDAIKVGEIGWEHLRQTDWLAELTRAVVAEIFEQMGSMPFKQLVIELGVTQEKFVDIAESFSGPIVSALKSQGVLEGLIRAQLMPFYAAESTQALIEK